MGLVSVMRADWSVTDDYWTFALPKLLQGIGMPFFFIGLTALALGSVKDEEIISAAGLMSFMRTLSGAIGTAIATTAWDVETRVSRSELVPVLNDPAGAIAKMQSQGMTMEQARASLDRMVEVQATTVGVSHVYIYAALIFGLAAAMVWFIPRLRGAAPVAAGH